MSQPLRVTTPMSQPLRKAAPMSQPLRRLRAPRANGCACQMNRFKLGEGTQGTKQTMKDSTSIFHWQRRAAEGPYRGPKKHLYKTLQVGLHELETSTAWVKQVPIPISPMSEARIGEGEVGWARKSLSHKGSKRGRNRLCKHSIDPHMPPRCLQKLLSAFGIPETPQETSTLPLHRTWARPRLANPSRSHSGIVLQ